MKPKQVKELDQEHYQLTISAGGGTSSQCACGKIFSFTSDLEGHIEWQRMKLGVLKEKEKKEATR